MWFLIYNFTSGQSTFDTFSFSANPLFGSTFNGQNAECIIERPASNVTASNPAGTTDDLGLYVISAMKNCVVAESPGGANGYSSITYNGTPSIWIGTLTTLDMKNGSSGDLLTQTVISPGVIDFFWTNWQ
jgi:hypothetical protein